MPVKIEVSGDTGVATGIGTGELTLDDMRAAATSLWSQPDFAGTRVLWDLRDASFSLSSADVQRLAAFVKTGSVLRPSARMAFVVSNDLEFGLLRMFEVFREQPEVQVHVFRDRAEADAWLGGA